MTDINTDPESTVLATSENQLEPDLSENEDEVSAPDLSDDEKSESDKQDEDLKASLARRSASQDTDDERFLGLAPGDTED